MQCYNNLAALLSTYIHLNLDTVLEAVIHDR